MQAQISICRRRENLYLKLQGNFDETSSDEILHALQKLLVSSLQISSPETQVLFAFQTRAKVDLPKGRR
jgi:hypothetical protein